MRVFIASTDDSLDGKVVKPEFESYRDGVKYYPVSYTANGSLMVESEFKEGDRVTIYYALVDKGDLYFPEDEVYEWATGEIWALKQFKIFRFYSAIVSKVKDQWFYKEYGTSDEKWYVGE